MRKEDKEKRRKKRKTKREREMGERKIYGTEMCKKG
jgi:hypothetical protein